MNSTITHLMISEHVLPSPLIVTSRFINFGISYSKFSRFFSTIIYGSAKNTRIDHTVFREYYQTTASPTDTVFEYMNYESTGIGEVNGVSLTVLYCLFKASTAYGSKSCGFYYSNSTGSVKIEHNSFYQLSLLDTPEGAPAFYIKGTSSCVIDGNCFIDCKCSKTETIDSITSQVFAIVSCNKIKCSQSSISKCGIETGKIPISHLSGKILETDCINVSENIGSSSCINFVDFNSTIKFGTFYNLNFALDAILALNRGTHMISDTNIVNSKSDYDLYAISAVLFLTNIYALSENPIYLSDSQHTSKNCVCYDLEIIQLGWTGVAITSTPSISKPDELCPINPTIPVPPSVSESEYESISDSQSESQLPSESFQSEYETMSTNEETEISDSEIDYESYESESSVSLSDSSVSEIESSKSEEELSSYYESPHSETDISSSEESSLEDDLSSEDVFTSEEDSESDFISDTSFVSIDSSSSESSKTPYSVSINYSDNADYFTFPAQTNPPNLKDYGLTGILTIAFALLIAIVLIVGINVTSNCSDEADALDIGKTEENELESIDVFDSDTV